MESGMCVNVTTSLKLIYAQLRAGGEKGTYFNAVSGGVVRGRTGIMPGGSENEGERDLDSGNGESIRGFRHK